MGAYSIRRGLRLPGVIAFEGLVRLHTISTLNEIRLAKRDDLAITRRATLTHM